MLAKNDLSEGQSIAYIITTTLVVLIFFVTGIGNIVPFDHIAHDMAHLGYPAYFSTILGIWKIMGAAVLAVPKPFRGKDWAYTGMMLDLTGAAFSRIAIGDELFKVIMPLVIFTWVIISWRLYTLKTIMVDQKS